MTVQEKARELHGQGYNCSQSVLISMKEQTGLEEETAANIASGFGKGVACREICGAISGAVMAAGMKKVGAENRPQVYDFDRELAAAFQEKFGALRCEDLKAKGISCDDLIAYAAEKAEELLSGC